MKLNHKKTLAAGLSLMMFLPLFVFSAIVPTNCAGTTPDLCNFDAFMEMINGAINWFIGISASVAAITFSIAGGKMLLNPESDSERQAAKDMFKKTVIGLFFVLGAWLIVHTIVLALVKNPETALKFLGGK